MTQAFSLQSGMQEVNYQFPVGLKFFYASVFFSLKKHMSFCYPVTEWWDLTAAHKWL